MQRNSGQEVTVTNPADEIKTAKLYLSQGKLTMDVALKGNQISKFKKQYGIDPLVIIIADLVLDLSNSLNLGRALSRSQMVGIAEAIVREYWFLKMAELVYFFEQAKCAKWGKAYDRLDQAVIFEWLKLYDQERTEFIQTHTEEKHNERKSGVSGRGALILSELKKRFPNDYPEAIEDTMRAGYDDPEYKAFRDEYNRNAKAEREAMESQTETTKQDGTATQMDA